jgi:MFS family permease
MIVLVAPIGALLLSVTCLLLGNGLLNTILVMRSEVEAFGGFTVGLIMSSYFIGFLIGTYLALLIIRRVGHIRAFAMCASLIACCALLHILFIDSYVWMLLRVVNGAALVILFTVIESWLNIQTPSERRGQVFAVYMTVNLSAIALAQQLLALDDQLTFLLFSIASIFISISLIPIAWTKLKQPEVHDVTRISFKKLYQFAPVATLGALLSGLVMGAFWGIGVLYAGRVGLSATEVGTFISFFILGGALLQFPIGRLSDDIDRRKMIAVVAFVAALLACLFVVIPKQSVPLYSLGALFGGLVFTLYPLSVAHLIDHLEPHEMLAGGSSLLLLHGVGAVIGPLLTGQLLESLGAASLPSFWVVILLVLAIASYAYQQTTEEENPEEYVADFVPMVRTTPTALEMLPQEESEFLHDPAPVWGSADTDNIDEDDSILNRVKTENIPNHS